MRFIAADYIILVCLLLMFSCFSENSEREKTTDTVVIGIPLCGEAAATLAGMSDLPSPRLRLGIGNSHLPVNTASKEAQLWFDQGLNHLHGFWHLEAYRAFQQVIKSDSNCAMGYWGIAMCQPGFGGENKKVWLEAINKAVSLKSKASPLEKALIEATEYLIRIGLGVQTVEKFRTLYKDFPNDPEAIAFAAIMLRQYENEATQQEVKTLLEKALRRFPDNTALMHYYIHVMELRPEFGSAQKIAEKMTEIAPNALHLTHMPGHLYFLAGEYEKAIAAYSAAKKEETAYHLSEKIPFSANQNYIHNLHFLAVAQAEAADYPGALATAVSLSNVTLSSAIPNDGAATVLLYEGRILPALVHIRFREWQKAIAQFDTLLNSLDRPIQNPLVRTYFQVMRLYCMGMQAVSRGEIPQAITCGGELSQLMKQYEQQGAARQNTPEFKNINETFDIMSMARYELAGWIDNMDKTQPFNDAAWKEAIYLQSKIKYDEPPRLMYPVEESLARLHLIRGEKEAYRQAKKQALKRRPKSKVMYNLI